MKKVQKTFFTCSFFPNASIAASVSAFIARWISFGRNTNSGRNRTAAPMNARLVLVRVARKFPTGAAKVRSRISGESEPPVRRASESLSVCVFASAATSIPRSGMRGAGPGSRWRRSNATSQGRHPISRKQRETAR